LQQENDTMKTIITAAALALVSQLALAGGPETSLDRFNLGNPDHYQGIGPSGGGISTGPSLTSLDIFNRGNPDHPVAFSKGDGDRTARSGPVVTSLDVFNRGNPDHGGNPLRYEPMIQAGDAVASSY
jgi:hypothetical protein